MVTQAQITKTEVEKVLKDGGVALDTFKPLRIVWLNEAELLVECDALYSNRNRVYYICANKELEKRNGKWEYGKNTSLYKIGKYRIYDELNSEEKDLLEQSISL